MSKKNGPESIEIDQYWRSVLGSDVIEISATEDRGEAYTMEQFHIYKLRNGKYATVHESGCSCYSSSDAVIDLHPTLRAAKAAMDQWRKDCTR